MKFRKGDRVIVVTKAYDVVVYPQYLLTGTVVDVDDRQLRTITIKYDIRSDGNVYFETDLEHEHVYNSPLYKALT